MPSPVRAQPEAFSAAFASPLRRVGVDLNAVRQGWSPDGSSIRFYRAFAQVRRALPERANPDLTAEEVAALSTLYPGFEPDTFPLPVLARVWLMLNLPASDVYPVVSKLLTHAEIGEQVAIYRGIYALAEPDRFAAQVAEGVRTNMVDIFDAVALHNPVAPWLLDEVGWTQLVLKAVFMARPLYRIVGLDERRSQALADRAVDYAHERWSAGRSVTPELWRLVAEFGHHETLKRAAASAEPLVVKAATLAQVGPPEASAWRSIGESAEAQATVAATRDVLYPSPIPDSDGEA
ncbi:MAG: EboA domain-containing protein [Myxococcota bacterium]